MKLSRGINELLFPSRCLGCNSLNDGLCPRCMMYWKTFNFRTHLRTLSVFSSVSYTPIAKNILLAAKEDGIREADTLLGETLRHSYSLVKSELDAQLILIPIPSTSRAVRRRGRDFISEIAKRLGSLEKSEVRYILRHNRSVQDQSRLNANARFENLSGAFSVASGAGRCAEVLLVDDLVTTGATLNEANRALTIAGFTVRGAITACVALPLR